MFLCQLTGAVPSHPVVTSEGNLYEKTALLNYLQKHDNCDPLTKKKLNPEHDLIEIQSTALLNKPSSAIALGDITTILQTLGERTQEIMIELQDVKRERDEARHQLTHLLYLRDSAAQVIAKHIEEIDFLKAQLKEARQHGRGEGEAGERLSKMARTDGAEPDASSTSQFSDLILNLSTKLMQARKQRKIIARPADALQSYQRLDHPSHDDIKREDDRAQPSNALCFTNIISRSLGARRMPGIFAIGYDDKTIDIRLLPDEASKKPVDVTRIVGHDGPVTCLESLVYPSTADLSEITLGVLNSSSSTPAPFESCLNIFSGSSDGTVRHWKDPNTLAIDSVDWLVEDNTHSGKALRQGVDTIATTFTCQSVYKPDLSAITSLKLHPCGTMLAVTGETNRWTLLDLISSKQAAHFKLTGVDPAIKCRKISFQPDGSLAVGATTDAALPIWDVRTGGLEARPITSAPVASLSFSENGYHVAVATVDNQLSIWDLRKLAPRCTLSITDIISCQFDHSGKHIAVLTDCTVQIVSAVEKNKFEIVASWSSPASPKDLVFDQRTDDYVTMLASDGSLSTLHAY